VNLDNSPGDTKEDPSIKKNPLNTSAADAAKVQKKKLLDNKTPMNLAQFLVWA
jgi:hypothetical protein